MTTTLGRPKGAMTQDRPWERLVRRGLRRAGTSQRVVVRRGRPAPTAAPGRHIDLDRPDRRLLAVLAHLEAVRGPAVTDWRKIEREDRHRHDQVAWQFGWGLVAIAGVGVVGRAHRS